MIVGSLMDGTDLPPGTPIFMRVRYRDIYNNLSLPSEATSMVVRYTNKHPGCLVYRAVSLTAQFTDQKWTAFPFLANGGSPTFDTYGNWHTGYELSGTDLPALTATSLSSAFFRMPCDGVCSIDARVGLAAGPTGKANKYVRFGLMRLNSDLPGGGATNPVVVHAIGHREGAAFANPATTFFVGDSCSVLFVTVNGRVSAHSGDYITVGVFPEDVGVMTCASLNTGSGSTSYAHFSVIQD